MLIVRRYLGGEGEGATGEPASMARRERIDREQWIFSPEIASEYREHSPVSSYCACLVSQPTESLTRGVNPFRPDAAGSRSAQLIPTLTTRSSHRPAKRYKRLARCAYSLTIPLVALLVLRFTCLTPSVRPYYVPRGSLLLALVLPPPPKSMLLADREFSLRLATARVTSFLPCPSLAHSPAPSARRMLHRASL